MSREGGGLGSGQLGYLLVTLMTIHTTGLLLRVQTPYHHQQMERGNVDTKVIKNTATIIHYIIMKYVLKPKTNPMTFNQIIQHNIQQ